MDASQKAGGASLRRLWRALPQPVRATMKRVLPASVLAKTDTPPVGRVRFGDFRRTTPFCDHYGYTRGQPVDRYYIENFLSRCATDVRGRVLEIGDNSYATRFGGRGVTTTDVLHVAKVHDGVTIVGDLESGENIPSSTYDCFICTQTLMLIYDLEAAMTHAHRCLKSGGVLLCTVAAITPFARTEREEWNAYWRLTSPVMRHLTAEAFGPTATIEVRGHGNVLAASSYLFGLASSELTSAELDINDPGYEVVVTVRAVKS